MSLHRHTDTRSNRRVIGGKLFKRGDKKPDEDKDSKTVEVKDGQAAVVRTHLGETDATARVKAFFNSKDLDFTVNPDTGRITSDWYGERRCGSAVTIGKTPQRCAYRATIRIASDEDQTVARVQVFERRRDAAINMNNGPWNEDSTSKGKPTSELAAEFAKFLGASAPTK